MANDLILALAEQSSNLRDSLGLQQFVHSSLHNGFLDLLQQLLLDLASISR